MHLLLKTENEMHLRLKKGGDMSSPAWISALQPTFSIKFKCIYNEIAVADEILILKKE